MTKIGEKTGLVLKRFIHVFLIKIANYPAITIIK